MAPWGQPPNHDQLRDLLERTRQNTERRRANRLRAWVMLLLVGALVVIAYVLKNGWA